VTWCATAGLRLDTEVFRDVDRGLSEFVHQPEEGIANIRPLVTVAMETVPRHLHSSTPLMFKATAGLRLLDAEGAERLLVKVG
jgi:Golgi nucleoside diphosphatase